MEFSNLFFLYLFLPISIGLYYLMPKLPWKNGILLLFSLLFYCISDLCCLPLLLLAAGCHYLTAKYCKGKALGLWLPISLDIGLLLGNKLFSPDVFPVGLSFYTFSLIAYQVDVSRKKTEVCSSFWEFLLFVSFFPKLLMGPIVRYCDFAPQLQSRNHEPKAVFEGAVRFCAGLGKKLLLADQLFSLYASFETLDTALSVWLQGLCFMLYIYFEFSGYGDMAIGLSRVFGFSLKENFVRPYCSTSVSDFWRRWHISLGSFFRDYVYIPLGGNRKGALRQIINLLLVWLLTGAWHGLRVNFLLWGLYFFFLLVVEKHTKRLRSHLPRWLCLLLTQGFVLLGWILFSATDLSQLRESLCSMVSFHSFSSQGTWTLLQNACVLLPVSLLGVSPAAAVCSRCYHWLRCPERGRWVQLLSTFALFLLAVGLLILCTAVLVGGASKPSMYASF